MTCRQVEVKKLGSIIQFIKACYFPSVILCDSSIFIVKYILYHSSFSYLAHIWANNYNVNGVSDYQQKNCMDLP